jgi:exopolysaccharide biosynthesis protein
VKQQNMSNIHTVEDYQGAKIHNLTFSPEEIEIKYVAQKGRVSDIAKQYNADFACNATFIDYATGGALCGHTWIENKKVSDAYQASTTWLSLIVDKDNKASISFLGGTNITDSKFSTSLAPLLVDRGNPCWNWSIKAHRVGTDITGTNDVNKFKQRTFFNVTKDGKFIVSCTDHRFSGLSIADIGLYTVAKNTFSSINGDGGGSSTLWSKQHGILNNAIGAYERPVNHAILFFIKHNPEKIGTDALQYLVNQGYKIKADNFTGKQLDKVDNWQMFDLLKQMDEKYKK